MGYDVGDRVHVGSSSSCYSSCYSVSSRPHLLGSRGASVYSDSPPCPALRLPRQGPCPHLAALVKEVVQQRQVRVIERPQAGHVPAVHQRQAVQLVYLLLVLATREGVGGWVRREGAG